jgi:hypothetical protein
VEASYSKESPLTILRKHQMDMSRMARIAENQGAEVARRKYGMLESALEDASNAGGKWSENPEMRLLMQVDSGGKPVGAASFQKGDVYGISNKDIMDMDFTGPEPGTLHSLGVLGQTEGGVPFKRGEEYIRQAQDMLGNDNLLFETINKPEFSNLEYYYNLGARPTGKKRNGGNPFYEFTQRAEREAPEVNENQLRLPGMAKGGWMDFTKSPTRASKQLHVSPKDIQQGHQQDLAALVARVAEQSRTVPSGEPYGQTMKPEVQVPSDSPEMTIAGKLNTTRPDALGAALVGAPIAALTGMLGRGSMPAIQRAAPKIARMIGEGIRSRPAILGGFGLGAATEMLDKDPSVQGALVKGAEGAAGMVAPIPTIIAELAAHSGDVSAMPFVKWLPKLVGSAVKHGPEGVGLYVNPTYGELKNEILRDGLRSKRPGDFSVRMMQDSKSPNDVFAWDGTDTMHKEVSDSFNRPLSEFRGSEVNMEDGLEAVQAEIERLRGPVKMGVGGSIAGAAKRMAQRSMPRLQEGASSAAAPRGALSVVKPKGGNWLNNSVEDALKGLRRQQNMGAGLRVDPATINRTNFTPEQVELLRPTDTMNSWISGPLTKYVKRDLATPEDPVRRLAEEGVLHFDPRVEDAMRQEALAQAHRRQGGFSEYGGANNPLGKSWETLSDASINPVTARDLSSAERSASFGGKSDIDPDTVVHMAASPMVRGDNLGFNHLIDELGNALNPNSGLPTHLQLTPEAVQKMGIEKAVRRVADINAWRAEQAALAEKKSAQSILERPALRQYDDQWRWITNPDTSTDEGLALAQDLGCRGGWCTQSESAAKTYGTNGNQLHILVDHEGRPHAQIQVSQPRAGDNDKVIRAAKEQFGDSWEDYVDPAIVADWSKPKALRIEQIKPPENSWGGARVAEYTKRNPAYKTRVQAAMQDFVKSPPHGAPWGDVGDLGNAGLTKVGGRYADDAQMRALSIKHFGTDDTGKFSNGPGNGEAAVAYYNRMKRMEQSLLSDIDKNFVADIDAGNFASGGEVSTKPNIRDIMQKLQEYHANA